MTTVVRSHVAVLKSYGRFLVSSSCPALCGRQGQLVFVNYNASSGLEYILNIIWLPWSASGSIAKSGA